MEIHIAKDPLFWNKIVEKSPYSVLYHTYEWCVLSEKALPIIISEQNQHLLFPLKITELSKSLRLATSSIHSNTSILPDTEETVDLIPKALDHLTDFLDEMRVDYLSTCAPAFMSKQYANLLYSWFKKHKAGVQIIYSHMIRTKDIDFDEIWKHRFEKHARNQVRKAKKEGVQVTKIDTVEKIRTWIEGIHQCNLSALERQGRMGAYPDSDKDTLLSELISAKKLLGEHVNIYGAVHGERLIAYVIVVEYNKLIQITKAMSHTNFLGKCPNDALIAHTLKEACNKGFHWVEYGFDRVKRNEKIPSLNPSLLKFKFKFGFEEIPTLIFRLGLTRSGRIVQRLYSSRERLIAMSAYIPRSFRRILMRIYAPRRRKLSAFISM